jgi:5-methylcytosine-specific restriction enzyme A
MGGTRVPPRDAPGGYAKSTGKCRWCRAEVKPPRRSFCGEECVHQHRLRTDGKYRREHVFKRDGGICSKCGRDCLTLERDLLRLLYSDPSKLDVELTRLGLRRRTPREVDHRRMHPDRALVMSLRGETEVDFSLPAWEPGISLWAADHRTPVFEGGGSTGPENCTTLCIWCHKVKTREEAGRRAALKKEPPPGDLFPFRGKLPPGELFEDS